MDTFFPAIKRKDSLYVLLNIETLKALVERIGPKVVDQDVKDGAEAFFFDGKKEVGILMVHGFGSSPAEFKELARLLHEKKQYTINGVRLFGHGTSITEQAFSEWVDWYYSVIEGYDQLRARGCKKIYVVGHSMGGTLVLLLSATRKVDAIVSLCAPLDLGKFYHGLPIPYLKYVAKFIRRWPRRKESIILQQESGSPVYTEHSLSAVVEMFDLLEVTKDQIGKIEAPLLTVGAKNDYHVPLSNIKLLKKLVKSKRVEEFIATKSGHTIILDKEKDQVFKKILDFFDELEKNEKTLEHEKNE
ncbi:MAG: alpha/beta hydrolase [Candidatus Heimdallarchaeaceae archaeon]